MSNRRFRVLLVSSHPVQYVAPVFRRMAHHPKLDIQVAYCDLHGAEAAIDPEFGIEVKWDIPLLEGYQWVYLTNRSPRPRLNRFWGLINPGLWKMVMDSKYDAVVVNTGYVYASFWIVLLAAKLHGCPLLFGTDAASLAPRDGRGWKRVVKKWLWPRLFRLASVVIVPSSRSVELMRSLGIADSRMVLIPYVVNNEWWVEQSRKVDRYAVRRSWDVPDDSAVVLFCAKLQPWKRPGDVLNAFAQAEVAGSHLVFAGDGPLRAQLEGRAKALGLEKRTHFLGFTNQSQLPAAYRASDVMVLPSEYEPFGVVVNEAMLCGCPSIVSDAVGAGGDLISSGQNGYVFPCRNVRALAAILGDVLPDAARLDRMSYAARKRMETWSPREHIEALLKAVELAVCRKGAGTSCGSAFDGPYDAAELGRVRNERGDV